MTHYGVSLRCKNELDKIVELPPAFIPLEKPSNYFSFSTTSKTYDCCTFN